MTSTENKNSKEGLDLSVAKVVGSALAGLTAAVAASGLGVAGTLMGAALGSVVITAGTSIYSHLFHRTSHHLRKVPDRVAEVTVGRSGQGSDHATSGQDRGATRTGPHPAEAERQTKRRSALRKFAVTAALIFALTMTAITVFELAVGRSLSSVVGGSDDKRPSLVQVGVPGGEDSGDGGLLPERDNGPAIPNPLDRGGGGGG